MASLQASQKGFIEGAMDEWWRKSTGINILVTGMTGTGKSSLVNAILGKEVAEVGKALDPQTMSVDFHEEVIQGVKVKIWDSPGLQDGLNNEEKYLEDIKSKCKDNVDLFLYCISMTTTRFTKGSRDIDAMCKLTQALGKKLWENAVIILTCANRFILRKKADIPESERSDEIILRAFNERVDEWNLKLRECLKNTVELSPEVVEKVPIVPAGRIGLPILLRSLPPWLSNLWMESLLATRYDAQPALIKMNLERLRNKSDIRSEEEFSELLKKECIIIQDKATEIGRKLNATRAGKVVGCTSGQQAVMTYNILERIFASNPSVKLLSTKVTFDENARITAHMRVKIPMFVQLFPNRQ